MLLGIKFAENGIRHERYRTIVQYQLEIGPGADGLHGSILSHEDILVTVVLQGRVSLGDEEVTVVDDGVVVARLVVTVVITDVEEGHVAQVAVGFVGNVYQIATYLSEKDGTVANGLQFVENADDAVNGVGSIVQIMIVHEGDVF